MFCIEIVTDIIKVQAADLHSGSTLHTVHHEIDVLYPNRILMDIGLVIGRYNSSSDIANGTDVAKHTAGASSSSSAVLPEAAGVASNPILRKQKRKPNKFVTKLGHGVCQGSSAHFRVTFAVIVFRPFVGEVLVGTIIDSTESGITVSVGFFAAIFVPVYWMLNPSVYENGVWVWIPAYDNEDEDDDDMDTVDNADANQNDDDNDNGNITIVKKANATDLEPQRYEMNIGTEIRFRVKSINFTRVTATAKGMQAVTSSTVSSPPHPSSASLSSFNNRSSSTDHHREELSSDVGSGHPLRRRSSSVGLDEKDFCVPSAMHIVASICEDGLGLTSWWATNTIDDGDEQ